MPTTRSVIVAIAALALSFGPAHAQNLTGRWIYTEDGQRATLELRPDAASGRVTGTLDIAGSASQLAGRVDRGTVIIESLDGAALDLGGITVTAAGEGAVLLTIARQGRAPVQWRMLRDGARQPASGQPSREPQTPSTASAPAGFRVATAREFAGAWQSTSDDGSSGELLELQLAGERVQGLLSIASVGFFSGQVRVEQQLTLDGTVRNGALEVTLRNREAPSEATQATLRLRGEFLIFLVDGVELGAYAREGRALVASAEGSADAAALARALRGKVYSLSQQAAGRGGFVGGRVKVAFCADGSITLDASDVGTVPGALPGDVGGVGTAVSRRGRWEVVLLGGAPAIRAHWQGTGTTYSLTQYVRVRPAPDGRSALIDGARIPVTGGC